MSGNKSRDAIANWFFADTAGGRYLQPRRDAGRDGTNAPSGPGMGPGIRYVGVLLDISMRFTDLAPLVRVGNQWLFLLPIGFLPSFIDLVKSRANPSAALQLPLLLVPLPLVDEQVCSTLRSPTPDPGRLPSEDPTLPDIPDGLRSALQNARVIHAVIDDTIMPIHHHTRLADGSTRYAAIWHQDGVYKEKQSLRFGRVWYRDEINTILTGDPACIRRAFGHDTGRATGLPTGAIAMSHGGAVVDLFAGYSPRDDLFAESVTCDEDRPIIGVQLPAQAFWDSSGLALGFFISTALDFITKVAAGMAGGKKPMVINLSYGMTAGPHDGTSFIERVIDKLLLTRRRDAATEMVLPVGNGYLARHRWQQEVASGVTATFELEIPPRRARPCFVETWFTWPQNITGANEMLTILLSGPDGWTVGPRNMKPGDLWGLVDAGGVAFGRIAFEKNPTDTKPSARRRVSLMLAPTHHPHPDCPVTRPGLWKLEITPLKKLTFEAWIQRDDDPVGFPARTPSIRFRYPDRQTEMAQRSFTASAKVTGKCSIIGSGWRLSDGRIAPYSASYDPGKNPARGAYPTNPGQKQQYVFAAPSESSVALPGLRAAGNVGGRGGALGGTSAAAPVLARQLADMLASRPKAEVGPALGDIVKPNGRVTPPPQLAKDNPCCCPGHVFQDSWLGKAYGDPNGMAWTGEPAEYAQSRIGQGLMVLKGKALARIRRR